MTPVSRLLASGSGWRVDDVVCGLGPHDHAFEEQHGSMCVAAVTGGIFRYRSTQGAALLAPGALLLGNERHCYECSHEHGVGDRCVSFHFTSAFFEDIIAAVPGARLMTFTAARLPPLPALLPIVAAATAARDAADHGEGGEFEEIALQLVGAVAAVLIESRARERAPSRRDERRIATVLRHIEAEANEPLSLRDLASAAAMSPYHFLRTFRAVVGMAPHQFTLHTRMHRAAVRLRGSAQGIAEIAFAAGFNDLSTFNRRFQRIFGCSPSAYRRAHGNWAPDEDGRFQRRPGFRSAQSGLL